jgi:hypothetical protein
MLFKLVKPEWYGFRERTNTSTVDKRGGGAANSNVSLEFVAGNLTNSPAKVTAKAPGGSDQDISFTVVNSTVQSELLYLDGDGRASVGTTTPRSKLHISAGASGTTVEWATQRVQTKFATTPKTSRAARSRSTSLGLRWWLRIIGVLSKV